MTTLDYVQRAVCKDVTRPNICRVFRDKEHSVATDGHRLHAVSVPNPLTGAPTPHYLDGYDGQFPDWNQVVPKGSPIIEPTQLTPSRASELVKKGKGLLTAMKAVAPNPKATATDMIDLYLHPEGLIIVAENYCGFEARLEIGTLPKESSHNPNKNNPNISVSLRYLIEAIVPDEFNCINCYGALTPIRINSTIKNGVGELARETMAIIMPLRKLNKQRA